MIKAGGSFSKASVDSSSNTTVFVGLALILAGLVGIAILTYISLKSLSQLRGWAELPGKAAVYVSMFILLVGVILVGALILELGGKHKWV